MNFGALCGEFPLLRMQGTPRVCVFIFEILHLVADDEAGRTAQTASDRRSGARMTNGRADDRAGTRT